MGSDESEGGYGLGIWTRNRIREAGCSGRKRSEELGMRTITVHFDMAGAGIASLIKLAHRGEPGCLLAQVLSNRLVVSAYLDWYWQQEKVRDHKSVTGCRAGQVCLGEKAFSMAGSGVNTNEEDLFYTGSILQPWFTF